MKKIKNYPMMMPMEPTYPDPTPAWHAADAAAAGKDMQCCDALKLDPNVKASIESIPRDRAEYWGY